MKDCTENDGVSLPFFKCWLNYYDAWSQTLQKFSTPEKDYSTVSGKAKVKMQKTKSLKSILYLRLLHFYFCLTLLFGFEFLRCGFAVFENAVEHLGALGTARGELSVGLLLLIFQLVIFVGDVQRG